MSSKVNKNKLNTYLSCAELITSSWWSSGSDLTATRAFFRMSSSSESDDGNLGGPTGEADDNTAGCLLICVISTCSEVDICEH